MVNFQGLGIRSSLADALKKEGIYEATPVQEKAIPELLRGSDAIVQAQTGTGKTLAFLLPILEKIKPGKPDIQALIVTPTRELAIQITTEAKKLAPVIGSGVLAVYGGQDVAAQAHKLKGGANFIVATPGRLLDHLRRGTVHLHRVSMLVLDEADHMLAMGFRQEVEEILRQCPVQRQTMMFSATMPASVKALAERYMQAPLDIRIETERVTLEEIHQFVVETTDRARQRTLLRLIELYRPYLAVVFCRTKIRAKKLNDAMQRLGVLCDELHGDMTQAKREQVMKRFRETKLQVLVATDVAARGIDVEGITHVFHYDVPIDPETYIHRIGRTGRAGKEGVAIMLASRKDDAAVQHIERAIRIRLDRRRMEEFGVTAAPAEGSAARRERKAEPRGRQQHPPKHRNRKPRKGAGQRGRRSITGPRR